MFDWLQEFLVQRGLAPHGYCLLWEPSLVWTHVVSDIFIALAYFSIPFILGQLLTRRKDIEFGWMIGLFGIFIFACGMTHVMGIVTLWVPAYGLEAIIKVITALASVATAALLLPLLPRLVALPSPAQLQRANEALRYEAEMREKTEAMLRQSQKMEAIGQLTGGMAHDFNNLLGVVISNLDRVRRQGGEGTSRALENALAGAERAAELVDQLLAFARQKPLQTAEHDLNAVIRGLDELIPTTLGASVQTAFDLDPEPLVANIDRALLENAIINLALNSRDAMPDGGTLRVATRRRDDGGAEITVSDTGCGMSEETIARAIEPFFTTKPLGKGSGLGLSQVAGSIEQMGGRVEIESEQGTGTTVRLLFPRPSRGG
jgi:signal transduction histidine kinase